MARGLRLFWAVNLPEELKKTLSKVQDRLKTAGADARWVEPRNLHVTVKFLGDTDFALVGKIVDAAVGGLKGCLPFRLEVGGLGFFPRPSSPRVLWAGLRGEVDALGEVAGRMEEAMLGCGFPPEGRKFSPHLTLARIKSPRGAADLAKIAEAESSGAECLGSFEVSSVDLMRSDLTPRGPVYTLLASVRVGRT